MAKAVKKKAKVTKKSAQVTAKAKVVARSAKSSKKPAAAKKKAVTRRIDPLNSKEYRAVTPMLSVGDMRAAINFYTSTFGFKVKQVMDSPQGPMHAELTLRDTTLMLSPEAASQNTLSAKSIGNTPVTLYILVQDVDAVFGKAVAAGGTVLMPVADMFWGDRCGMIADLEGNKWMIATHKAEPSEAQMAEAMREMMAQQEPQAAAAAAGD